MKKTVREHLENQLHHLYINPLEKCNLRCKICYTKKTNFMLTHDEINRFIIKYNMIIKVDTITFCGGEVFTLPYFPSIINNLNLKGIFTQIITNGTVDRLLEITNPNMVNVIVSLDGLENYHDRNRGKGNNSKSISFLKNAIRLGFHTGIFSIVTKQNLKDINNFEWALEKELGRKIPITYHPRKPKTYLNNHPFSNIEGITEGFDYLENDEIIELMNKKNTFPPKHLGCYQVSLMSDGNIYGCCEGTLPIGTINDEINTVITNLKIRIALSHKNNLKKVCDGCPYPEFMCGIGKLI